MKGRILLALLVLTVATACSTQPLPTTPDRPNLDGGGMMGSGH